MRSNDLIRVRHMVEASREALSFVENKSRADLEENRLLAFALMRCIEIVGEAASKVSRESREAFPEIPWVDIVGMRNQLIHVYAEVDLSVLWKTVADDLPSLIPMLEAILAAESQS
jgi:uncharacterized protein with HEPN domain